MPRQKTIWTTLPNGVLGTGANRSLQLSVFVSPRLVAAQSEGDHLGLWPDWVNWPNRVGNASFKVTFEGAGGETTVDAKRVGELLEPGLWSALFKPNSFVRPHFFDNYSNRRIISYPARRLQRAVKRLYQRAGTQAPDGIAPRPPLSWEVDYLDLGTGTQPKASVPGLVCNGPFIYAVYDEDPSGEANLNPGRLVKIDRESRQIVSQVVIGGSPLSLAIAPDTNNPGRNKLYVISAGFGQTTKGDSSLLVIREDGNTFTPPAVAAKTWLGGGRMRLAFSPSRNHVVVTQPLGHKLQVLDGDGVAQSELSFETNEMPFDIAIDDAEGALYVTLERKTQAGPAESTQVVKLTPKDPKSYKVEWKTPIPPMKSTPPKVTVDPARGRVYATYSSAPQPDGSKQPGVAILDAATGAMIDTVAPARRITLDVTFSERFRYAYVLQHEAVALIGPGNRVVGMIPHDVPLSNGTLAVHPESQQVWMGSDDSGRLMIATPSTLDPPDGLDELYPGWNLPWTEAAQKEALANLERTELEDRDLTGRVLLFHRRPPEDDVRLPRTPEELRTLLDFHDALSTLGDYPTIMRKLGLVIDLEIPAALVPVGATTVRVRPTMAATQGVTIENHSVKTACVWDGTRFTARAATQELADGLLALDDARYELVQLDLDGAALKLANNAATIGQVAPGDIHGKAPPALRSAGVSLILEGHAAALKQQLNRSATHNKALETQGDTTLFAEDLVRGYRVDVWDDVSKAWRSLCQRRGTYTFGGDGERIVRTLPDEGIVAPSVTETASGPKAARNVYVHEALFRWDGWSLVARKPGKRSAEDGSPEGDDNAPVTPFKLQVEFTPEPGSLPKLRFGRTYRMRARVADLAGNSLTLDTAPDVGLPEQPRRFAYLRYEPVAQPAVVLRAPITEQTSPGEAVERLVVRTTNVEPSRDALTSTAIAERHIAAPRSSEMLAETHGAMDNPDGKLNADAYSMLAQRDAGQFPVDPQTNMPVEGAAKLELPYLPDVLSRGATLRNLPGTPPGVLGRVGRGNMLSYMPLANTPARFGSVTQISWGRGWPAQQPFRLVVKDGSGPPDWNDSTRALTVQLPKGEVARVPLSSFMREEDLKLMGVWEWLREYADERTRQLFERHNRHDPHELDELARQIAQAAHYALYGGHVMLSPAHELVLVHAVQQPLGRPVWSNLALNRDPNEKRARFSGALRIHGKSSSNVELRARWDEPIDDPKEGPPGRRGHQAVLTDIPIPPPDTDLDPKKPYITIKVGREHLARYTPATDRLDFVAGAQPEHILSDTRHRVVRYSAAATSRFREYFPLDAPGGFERASDELVVNLPSTARPAAPRVLYALPTFGWERRTESNVIASRRQGHGLRIYLERPWYSSGDGELLGVVIWPREFNDQDRARLKRFVSQAGADPLVLSSGAVQHLRRESFGAEGVTWATRLRLEEIRSVGRVDVAGHPVAYDAERDLWYCDIAFDATVSSGVEAYGAFVRLALVRYQPDSLPDLELSPVVTTDFLQVAPDRSAVATYDPHDPDVIRLVVAGQTYRATADHLGRTIPDGTFIEVSVEERRADIGGELGWKLASASNAIAVADQVRSIDTVLWQGRIKLPADRKPGQFRLVIKEWEAWLDDAAILDLGEQPRARRLVYADILEL